MKPATTVEQLLFEILQEQKKTNELLAKPVTHQEKPISPVSIPKPVTHKGGTK